MVFGSPAGNFIGARRHSTYGNHTRILAESDKFLHQGLLSVTGPPTRVGGPQSRVGRGWVGYNRPRLMSDWPKLRFVLTSFCLGMIALHCTVFWLARYRLLAGSPDFSIFYTAGLMVRHGQGSVLYSDKAQGATWRGVVPGADVRDHPLPFNHPPFEALLFVILTYLPYLRAYFLWFLVNLLLVGASASLMRSWLPTLGSSFSLLLILAPFAFFPIAYGLLQGQDSILLLVLYCLAYGAFRRSQDLRAGVFLGLGLFKFHLVLPFAFILLLRRRWQALGGILVGLVLDFAASWAVAGWKQLLYYPQYVLQINRRQPAGVIVPENMPNLRGLFTGWTWLKPVPMWLELALIAASLGLLVWASRKWRPEELLDIAGWNEGFSIAIVATFLVGYHSYNHDMSILLLPAFITLDRILGQGLQRPTARTGLIEVLLGLMFFSPLYLILTLYYAHENLFALVLLVLAWCLAVPATTKPRALGDTSTVPSSALLG